MILADTSIWIDYYRSGNVGMATLLIAGKIWMHPFVLGEVACGTLRNRAEELKLMRDLPEVQIVTDSEVLHFIEGNMIMGRGVGYVDVHLLASAAITDGVSIWTRDQRLHAVAMDLNLAYQEI